MITITVSFKPTEANAGVIAYVAQLFAKLETQAPVFLFVLRLVVFKIYITIPLRQLIVDRQSSGEVPEWSNGAAC